MIQEIAPHIYDNAFAHRRKLQPEDSVLAFTEDLKNVLVDSNGKFRRQRIFLLLSGSG